jgi:hypothetical protein
LNNSQEFEFAKLELKSSDRGRVFDLVKFLTTHACILGFSYMLFDGLKSIVLAQPESIKALADCIKNLKVSSILQMVTMVALGSWGAIERRQKKRLVKKLAVKRRADEASDPYRKTSGLTDSGDTPVEAK